MNRIFLISLAAVTGCASPQRPPMPPLPSTPAIKKLAAQLRIVQAAVATPQAVQLTVSRRVTPPPSVTLAWTASPDPRVGSYNLFYGLASGSYNWVTNTTSTALTVTSLAFGTTYFFAATAVSTNGVDESAYSNEVSWNSPTPISPPGTLSIQGWTASMLPGPWMQDTNFPPVLVQNPQGNQWWKLVVTRTP